MNHRRQFLKTTLGGTAGLIALPHIFSGSLFAADSPNKRIQVGQIGCGRMGLGDMEFILKEKLARVVAVCDLDSKRAAHAKTVVEDFYKKQGESVVEVSHRFESLHGGLGVMADDCMAGVYANLALRVMLALGNRVI